MVWRQIDVTPAWLTLVLRAAGRLADGAVASATLTPIGTGQMAESYRAALTYVGPADGPDTVVVKITSADESSRASGVQTAAYLREVRFYQELAPTLDVCVPRCLFAGIGENLADFVLVLEDLGPARPGDQLAGCTPDEAALVMEAAAGLHASRWGDAALAALDWLDVARDGREVLAVGYPLLFDAFCQRYGDRLAPDDLAPGRHLVDHLAEVLAPVDVPSTVQHGDLRCDNLLFDAAGGRLPLAVLDWQVPALGHGVTDVAYFLGTSVPVEDRRRHEDSLVRRYHGALEARGVRHYPWAACWDGYRRSSFAGYLMGTAASMLVGQTPRGDEMFLAMVRRSAAQVGDLGAIALTS